MGSITLKPGREKSVKRRHPWIFSGAIQKEADVLQNGETVDVLKSDGKWLARGAYSPHSQIRVRIWSFQPDEEIASPFFHDRLLRAIEVRKLLFADKTVTAYRLMNAESDGLPGLIVDRYGDFLVCQFLSSGVEMWKTEIVTQLNLLVSPFGIYERSDVDVRHKEGLKPTAGLLSGQMPPDLIEIQEGALRFWVDIKHGQKTGFYLDQRENRVAVAEFARGARVLNCFAYTGGFGLWTLHGGAEKLVNIESSASALALAQKNVELNGFDPDKVNNMNDDVFQILRKLRGAGKEFDLIILDPPKFADSAGQIQKASRGYKDINLLAFQLIKPGGGTLFTFSCSGHLSFELFQKIVSDAALDAGRDAQIIRYLSQAADHPIGLNFPEGRYLKGLVCRVG